MTTATIERLKQEIQAARDRRDGVEVARLYFQLPLSERNQPITAAGRYPLGPARVVSGSSARPDARTSLTRAPVAQTVAITPSLRNSLDDQFDGRENGGFLVGPLPSDGEIFATRAIAPAYDEDRTGNSVVLDLRGAARILETLPSDQTIVGDWHCHPHLSDNQPSSADLLSWERLSEFFQRPWLAIIARNAPTWVRGVNGHSHETARLELSATLVGRDNSGRFEHRSIPITQRSY